MSILIQKRRIRTLLLGFVLLLAFGLGSAFAADRVIYDDGSAAGWDNWSWSAAVNFANTSPIHGGARSLAVTLTGGWGALYLHQGSAIDTGGYDRLSFWIHGGSTGEQQLRVVANGDGSNTVAVSAVAGTWTQVNVPLSAIGNPSSLTDIYWQDTSGNSQNTFFLDDIRLIERTGPPPPPETGPSLNVNASAGRHTISDGIYGINYASEQLAADLRLPVRRWGGNSTSRYNWQNDTSNTGSDWYFENIPENNANPGALPNGSAADKFVEQDRRTGTKTLLTVPLLGWVAKQRRDVHPYDCGYKVSKYGSQQEVDPWDTDCGNGIYTNGNTITGNDPEDTSVEVGPSFVAAWVTHLIGRYGTAANGGVAYYNLDNEPMLWNSTHRDIHPQATTYDEIRDRTYHYAAAIKSADPSAQTLGPVVWGWCAYFYSAADNCSASGNDYQAHDSIPFVPWYLQQMKKYEQQHSIRILDYLDVHIYPQVDGVFSSEVGNADIQAKRLRSTRQLWDPTYIHEGWIGQPVYLIPRMKQWIANNYPGTKTAITEYNWGALGHINGALAQADILGIFGREGLDLATLWEPPTVTQPGAFSFRMYRNYDGAGHQFGDISVQATSSDQEKLSVYAAQRSTDNALTLLVINKTAASLTSTLNLFGYTPKATAAVYRYSASDTGSINRLTDQTVSSSGFSATFPDNSITLFILSQNGPPNNRIHFLPSIFPLLFE